MNKKRYLALFMALALTAVPITALADDLTYDDNTFESSTPLSLTVAPAVHFTAPGSGVYALDSVSFQLQEAVPGGAPAGTYPATVQIWDDALAVVETVAWDVDFTGSGIYTLDLTAAKLPFTGSIRIGIFVRDDALVPLPGTVSLGVDTTAPAGFSYAYDATIAPPLDPWVPAAGNFGIRASIHLVPAMTCQGFLPPLNRTLTMKRGGRTIPLKAFLFDDTGAPVSQSLLSAPPQVQLIYAPEAGEAPVDVTALVAPAGRSNKERAFRSTDGGRWIFNLKTKKFLPPGTYTVLMGSGDGAGYVVEPTCAGTFVIETPTPKKTHPARGRK